MKKITSEALEMVGFGMRLMIAGLFLIIVPYRYFPKELRKLMSENPEIWPKE